MIQYQVSEASCAIPVSGHLAEAVWCHQIQQSVQERSHPAYYPRLRLDRFYDVLPVAIHNEQHQRSSYPF